MSIDKLEGVHPKLANAVMLIRVAMAQLGFKLMVTDGLRTAAQQQALFAQGRTTPGPIVTNADGVKNKSNHQAHADGWGHAVDCCFVVDGQPSWADSLPWALYGLMAKSQGLKWGGDWTKPDRPHIELEGA